jgi:hypothetical protein
VLASIFMVVSAGIILALGVPHLICIFSGKKLTSRDTALQVRMAEVSPVITRQTTMWKAWIGFNASHHNAGWRVEFPTLLPIICVQRLACGWSLILQGNA